MAARRTLDAVEARVLRTESESLSITRELAIEGRDGGMAGITESRYRSESTSIPISQWLSSLSVQVVAGRDEIRVEGAVPVTISTTDAIDEFRTFKPKVTSDRSIGEPGICPEAQGSKGKGDSLITGS
jgi:hypothetical protein